jgi:alcohol dehydrogenase, propanol-preferring
MYKAIQVTKPGEFATVMKPPVDPGPGHVRIRVEACGVCHSDAGTVEGSFPIHWPRVPGLRKGASDGSVVRLLD